MIKNVFAVGLILLSGCKSRTYNQANVQSDATTAGTRAILVGLAEPIGSPERISAGEEIERTLEAQFAKFGKSGEPDHERGQELTRKMFRATFQYLKARSPSQLCQPHEKIRFYRGFSSSPLIGSSHSDNRYFMFDPYGGRLLTAASRAGVSVTPRLASSASVAEPKLEGPFPGQAIFDTVDRLQGVSFENLPWQTFLGQRRDISRRGKNIDLSFHGLSWAHTGDSANSPFISVSLTSHTASIWGPGYLVLDLCPQRAFLASSGGLGGTESEFLVPLFLLPEEITDVVDYNCAFLEGSENAYCNGSMGKFKKRWLEEKVSSATQSARSCYFPSTDVSRIEPGQSQRTRIKQRADSLYSELEKLTDFNQPSAILNAFSKHCTVDCNDVSAVYKNSESDAAVKAAFKTAWSSKCPL